METLWLDFEQGEKIHTLVESGKTFSIQCNGFEIVLKVDPETGQITEGYLNDTAD